MIARFVVGLLLASHSAVDAKVHRPYTLGGPDAACFKYDTNTPILPCTPLNSGEIVVEWATAFPPAIHALKPFTASWKITATAAFIAEQKRIYSSEAAGRLGVVVGEVIPSTAPEFPRKDLMQEFPSMPASQHNAAGDFWAARE